MADILGTLRNLGPIRLAAIGSVMLGILGFFGYLMTQTNTGNMSILYSQLDPADAARIVEKLESMGVPVDIQGDGTQLLIPKDRIPRARMQMAQEGLPSGGGVGYELFDRQDMFSTSGSMMDINRLRALEGELAKSITTISGVAGARIHLVLPKRELFSRDKTDPSASVILRMRSGRLAAGQIQSIQYLVASAVPDLPIDRISIVDDKGTLLAKSNEGDNTQTLLLQQEAQVNYEHKTARTLEDLLAQTLGLGRVRVEVTADIDFDKVTINSEKYDPDSQVARSVNTSQENSTTPGEQGGNVTVQNALPQDAPQGGANNTAAQSQRLEENTNFEISRTIETHQKEAGRIRTISVAVLVDGHYTKNAQGESTYAPRSAEDLERIKLLAATAIGFNEGRGDRIEVVNMPFAQTGDDFLSDNQQESWAPHLDVTKVLELAVLAAVGLLILMMIVRPVLLRVIESSGVAEMDEESAALLAHAQGLPAISDPNQESGGLLDPSNADYSPDQMVNMDNVEGRVRASVIHQVNELIEKNPEQAVTILRNWMYEESWTQEKIMSA